MSADDAVVCAGPRLALVVPGAERAADCLAYHRDNRAHLAPWEPPRAPEFWTVGHWEQRLAQARHDRSKGRALATWVVWAERPEGPLLGAATLSAIARGPFLACNLGFSLAETAQGQGIMTEALRMLCRHAFGELGLHRIQAAHLPHNARSAAVLARLGFVREGLARDYLFIDGAWRDHVLTSLTTPDPACRPAAARP